MFFFVGISRLIAKDDLVFFAQLKTQFVVLILLDDLSKVLYKYFVIWRLKFDLDYQLELITLLAVIETNK